jgi:hypothetical protein
MTKKHFIALADHIKGANQECDPPVFDGNAIHCLARFLAQQNSKFKRERWLSYVAGECGPSGGKNG